MVDSENEYASVNIYNINSCRLLLQHVMFYVCSNVLMVREGDLHM